LSTAATASNHRYGPSMQPKSVPPHTLSAKTRSPATTRASPRTPAAGSPRPNRIGQPSDPAETAMTPSAQHPAAARACDLPGSQPGLDADRIDLYRHHRCLRALRRDPPRSRQRLQRGFAHPSVPGHTYGAHEQDQPTATPTTTSPTSVTDTAPVVVIPRDAQQPPAIDRSLDPFSTDRLASETPDRAASPNRQRTVGGWSDSLVTRTVAADLVPSA
jgi:hypothetical protein